MGAKRVILCNTRDFPCPGSHRLHTLRFLANFEPFGYKFLELIEPGVNFEFAPGDVVYISNHGLDGPIRASQTGFLESLKKNGAVPIFWAWWGLEGLLNSIFGSKWILTGEKYLAKEVLPGFREVYEQLQGPQALPLRFAASLDPNSVEVEPGIRSFEIGYVGARYHVQLNALIKSCISSTRIVYTPPFVEENFRLSIYSSSQSILGWHSKNNVSNGVIGERVYEALAYGAVVVTENPYALEATDGNVLYAPNSREVFALLNRIRKDEGFTKRVASSGAKWAKSYGTYQHVVPDFIKRINSF